MSKELTLPKEVAETEIVQGVTLGSISNSIKAINAFQALVRSQLRDNQDYGIIPGTDKPTLLKPGAEKIAKLMLCADCYEVMSETIDWNRPLFAYTIKCKLKNIRTGNVISEGLGECNSYESKYRYRWVFGSDVPQGTDKTLLKKKTIYSKKKKRDYEMYRLENDDVFSQKNTILKMAKKRALVDAALSAGRLSDIFTQDMEDISSVKVEKKDTSAPINDNSFIGQCEKAKKEIGEKKYYEIMGSLGFSDITEIIGQDKDKFLKECRAAWKLMQKR